MSTLTSDQVVLYEKKEGVGIITLNRPDHYNAMTKKLIDDLVENLLKAEQDEEVKAIVLTGNGKAFCAGVDLKELTTSPEALEDDEALISSFRDRKKPLIGAINGFCMTGGLEMALNCDVLYAADRAVFADTHCKVGLLPTWGMSQKLPRLIGYNRAKELSLSGRKIDAQTAMAWGLVNRVFPVDEVLSEAVKLASEIANNNQVAVSGMKMLIDSGRNLGYDKALEFEYGTSKPHNDQTDLSVMMSKLNQMKGKK